MLSGGAWRDQMSFDSAARRLSEPAFCHLNLTYCGDTKSSMRRDASFAEDVYFDGKTHYETVWFQPVRSGYQSRWRRRRTHVVGLGEPRPGGRPLCRF